MSTTIVKVKINKRFKIPKAAKYGSAQVIFSITHNWIQ